MSDTVLVKHSSEEVELPPPDDGFTIQRSPIVSGGMTSDGTKGEVEELTLRWHSLPLREFQALWRLTDGPEHLCFVDQNGREFRGEVERANVKYLSDSSRPRDVEIVLRLR